MATPALRERVKELEIACSLLNSAALSDEVDAQRVLVENLHAVVAALGYGIHRAEFDSNHAVRGSQPAMRVETTADYVIRDVDRAAGLLRSVLAKTDAGSCVAEPFEEDPIGVLTELLDLEVGVQRLKPAIELIAWRRDARGMTASERSHS